MSEENEEIKKTKSTRARCAGWLTRAISNYEMSANTPTVLNIVKERISTQLTRLQEANDHYVMALIDDVEVQEADNWMQQYFQKATDALAEIDMKISKPKDDEPTHASQSVTFTAPPEPQANNTEIPSPSITQDNSSQESCCASISAEPIDAWIDALIPGQETASYASTTSGDLNQALARLEIERDLPKIELPIFDGSALAWPRFVEQFYVQVHSRAGLNDSRRMDLLQSHVKGEAKQLIQGLGYSARNYAQSLQELKFAFGHRVIVARAFVDAITSGNSLPSNDAAALRSFYITVRDCITVLHQLNYTGEVTSSDVLQRTCRRIPADKRGKWNDYVRNICRTREPTLKDLERWLKDCIESEFNPYAAHASLVNSNIL